MSTTASRKQREILEREAKILELARPMLLQGGYHGLSMERIASELQYAKGTIYNHFSCKEEIILALAIQTMEQRWDLFRRAAEFDGLSRERLQAIGVASELFVRLYPEHFMVEQIVRSASIWEKTSEARQQVIRDCESRCVSTVAGIVRHGVEQQDLILPEHLTPEELVFNLWSSTFGAYTIMLTSDSLLDLGIRDPYASLHHGIEALLDGVGWRPLSRQHDYEAVEQRILQEVFPDESRRVHATS